MKIKTIRLSPAEALARPKLRHFKPQKPWWILRLLIRLISIPDLLATRFKFTKERMGLVGKEPCLILMNHSSFIDLEIAYRIFFPKPFCIVSTTDGMVGKYWLMRKLGCIPTQKYVTDIRLIMDMLHAIRKNNCSILMYPEAGYSFDGCATTLPRKLGTLIKKLDVPLVSVITDGAYLRQPLYNNLRKRKVNVSAKVTCLLTREEIAQKSVAEIDAIIDRAFSFDNFKNQYKNNVHISEPHRAEGLERILYRCPACHTDGGTEGTGSILYCKHCGKVYRLNEQGQMEAESGETEFPHIPHWYDWQRKCVRKALEDGNYQIDIPVEIGILTNHKALYTVGKGRLTHSSDGFVLYDEADQILYQQEPAVSHSVNTDFYWYEMGDVVCIGNKEALYYCFPTKDNVAAKIRLAGEELYKLCKAEKR